MPLQATSGAASYDAFGGGVPVVPNYIEEVFSTYLYTGTGADLTITNGIDLSTKGGLVWIKNRTTVLNHVLVDTARGANKTLASNTTAGQITEGCVTAFNTNGFVVDDITRVNASGANIASWTFRKQPKFFDIQTWTGTGSNTTISHSLGSVPASIWVKRTDATGAWQVYHRSLANTEYLVLNTTAAKATGATRWNSTTPTSTVFSIGTDATVNASGGTYVAYIFAHDAGGFGLTGTDNVISCGSFTTDAGGLASVTLGYEPQWILLKRSSGAGSWYLVDTMRGWSVPISGTTGATNDLYANLSNAEVAEELGLPPNATGFSVTTNLSSSSTYIYIAIRRGPMKVPTSGTNVFSPQIYTEILTNPTTLTTSFPTDLHMISRRTGTTTFYVADRLRGSVPSDENFLETSSTAAETDYASSPPLFTSNTGVVITTLFNNIGSKTDVSYQFRRAPSFFDEVCYTGTGSDLTLSHNLQAVPQMIICKARSTTTDWPVYHKDSYNGFYGGIDLDSPLNGTTNYSTLGAWKATPTSSVFYLPSNTYTTVNEPAQTYVAYLFSTCAGVSKVGGYTGTGTTLQVDCGFTSGARFVLIRRTNATGDWYVWDTARGIVSGNDPYLLLNSTAAEVTTTDYIDTYSAGFEISSTAPAAINASGGRFIFLAIA